MSLASDFAVLIVHVEQLIAERGAQLVRTTHARLIAASPVLTGRYSSNHMLGVGQANPTTTTATSPMPLVLTRLVLGQTYYLSNALPYALALEHGHSRKAPTGIYSVVAAELQHGGITAGAVGGTP